VLVTKASREKEKYDGRKFLRSLRRSGIPSKVACQVAGKIERELHPGITTEEIYRKTFSLLLKEHPAFAGKYSLKRSIMELGPAGFFFEQYVAAVLEEYGYKTKTNQRISGRCSGRHEIDVVAEKGKDTFYIEAKYHNSPGLKSDIKTAMYTYARMLDISEAGNRGEAWLVTNTKFTSKAISYGKCRGLKLTGWRYPRKESLESLIEGKKLYPVTVLPSVTFQARERLGTGRVFFVRDLAGCSSRDLVKKFGLNPARAKAMCEESKEFFSI